MPVITVQNLPGAYPVTPLPAESADFTWGATDLGGDTFPAEERTILLFRNDNAAPQTVTVTSQTDPFRRLGSITTYSIGIGEYAAFGPFPPLGWADAAGDVNIVSSAIDVMVAVLKLV
jgi:hypothetical protein